MPDTTRSEVRARALCFLFFQSPQMTTQKIAIAAAAAAAAALLYLYRRRNRCQTVKAFYLMHAKDDDELPFIGHFSLPPDASN